MKIPAKDLLYAVGSGLVNDAQSINRNHMVFQFNITAVHHYLQDSNRPGIDFFFFFHCVDCKYAQQAVCICSCLPWELNAPRPHLPDL